MSIVVAIVTLVAPAVVIHFSSASHVRSHGKVAESLGIFLRALTASLALIATVVVLIIVATLAIVVVAVLVLIVAVVIASILLVGVIGVGVVVTTTTVLVKYLRKGELDAHDSS